MKITRLGGGRHLSQHILKVSDVRDFNLCVFWFFTSERRPACSSRRSRGDGEMANSAHPRISDFSASSSALGLTENRASMLGFEWKSHLLKHPLLDAPDSTNSLAPSFSPASCLFTEERCRERWHESSESELAARSLKANAEAHSKAFQTWPRPKTISHRTSARKPMLCVVPHLAFCSFSVISLPSAAK